MSTGFCLLNNAAIAMVYARVRWGLERIAVVDIDVHFGNGTAELLKDDPRAFFASVHMIYGELRALFQFVSYIQTYVIYNTSFREIYLFVSLHSFRLIVFSHSFCSSSFDFFHIYFLLI